MDAWPGAPLVDIPHHRFELYCDGQSMNGHVNRSRWHMLLICLLHCSPFFWPPIWYPQMAPSQSNGGAVSQRPSPWSSCMRWNATVVSSETSPFKKRLWMTQGPLKQLLSVGETCRTQSRVGSLCWGTLPSTDSTFVRENFLSRSRAYKLKRWLDSSQLRSITICRVNWVFWWFVHENGPLQCVVSKCSLTSTVYWMGEPMLHIVQPKDWISLSLGIWKWSISLDFPHCAPASRIACLYLWNSDKDFSMLQIEDSMNVSDWAWYIKSTSARIAQMKVGSAMPAIVTLGTSFRWQ